MPRSFVNVKEFGAAGDGVTDDTAAILNAIKVLDRYPPSGTHVPPNWGPVVYFPEGVYKISNTLLIENFFGLEIRGTGTSPAVAPTNLAPGSAYGPRSVLLWGGSAGGTVLHLRGVQGTTVRNLNFVGKTPTGGRALHLLELTSLTGSGTSMIAIKDCTFFDAEVGVKCGGGEETTDSELYLERVVFNDCDTAS